MWFACAGMEHIIFLDNDGFIWSLGSNDFGQIGQGLDIYNLKVPKTIPDLVNICSISTGGQHSICCDIYGKVWAFGDNYTGQLGRNSPSFIKTPVEIEELPQIISVECGGSHTICIDSNSHLWCFGCNSQGQLGLGDTTNRYSPVKHPTLSDAYIISCGGAFTFYINSSDEMYAFGQNNYGQLGLTDCYNRLTPERITNYKGDVVKTICCGFYHSVILTIEGDVFVCGSNDFNQLGIPLGENQKYSSSFLHLPLTKKIQKISASLYFSNIVDVDGGLWTMGKLSDTLVPKKIEFIPEVLSLSKGGKYTILKTEGDKAFLLGYCDYIITPNSYGLCKDIDDEYNVMGIERRTSKAKSARK